MSYNPCIGIENEKGESILSCDYSSGGYPSLEGRVLEMMNEFARQGLAYFTDETKSYYPAVMKVHKANEAVMNVLLPLAEEIAASAATRYGNFYWTQYEYNRTANNKELKQEHEEWKVKHENNKKEVAIKIAKYMEDLKSHPAHEGFTITAWGTL